MAKNKRIGRPSKLDAAASEKIIQALRAGAFRKVAAVWAGIGERTFRDWMREGRENPSSAFGSFRRKVLEAESAAEIAVGATAFKAAASDPAYSLLYLRIRWRKRWEPQKSIALSGGDGSPVTITINRTVASAPGPEDNNAS
jgi:hypothetical protein